MTCQSPIAWETLVEYWAGELDADATAALDEHLFECAACTAASARVAAVTEAVRAAVPLAVSPRRLERLRAGGVRVRENTFAPGDRREVEFSPESDLLIHRLSVDGLGLTGDERIALRVSSESTGALMAVMEEAPFDPAEGAVLVACQRHYSALPHDTVMEIAIHAPGAPTRTATYTILHRFL
jgi:hypothetical protein